MCNKTATEAALDYDRGEKIAMEIKREPIQVNLRRQAQRLIDQASNMNKLADKLDEDPKLEELMASSRSWF